MAKTVLEKLVFEELQEYKDKVERIKDQLDNIKGLYTEKRLNSESIDYKELLFQLEEGISSIIEDKNE